MTLRPCADEHCNANADLRAGCTAPEIAPKPERIAQARYIVPSARDLSLYLSLAARLDVFSGQFS
jgi:hypothetical protein